MQNVLVILCDQLRKDFLPVYGGQAIDTPNIDLLAKDGVVFDQCITQSTVCAPARASMLTGRYVSDHKVWTNDVEYRDGLDFIGQRMHEEGYATGAFGKLHNTPGTDTKGFRHSRLMEENRLKEADPYFQFLKEHHPEVENIFQVDKMNHQFIFGESYYYENYIAQEAMKFIKENKEKPTFSWVSFQGPHTPYDPPKKWRGKVRTDKLAKPIVRPANDLSETARYRSATRNIPKDMDEIMSIRQAYGEMIMHIDEQIGKLITCLKDEGLYDKTTIIFSADHGDMLGDMNIGEKGPFLYNSQLGIPMIVCNGQGLEKGVRSEACVGNIDIPGTVLDIAGASKSIGYSKSILNYSKKSENFTMNYSEFCDSIRTVDDGRYRYSYYPFEDYSELYDRYEDPEEIHNLAGQDDYMVIESKFLKHIIEFGIIGKGIRIETQDLVPSKQKGIRQKYENFLDDFPIVFPLASVEKYRRIEKAGLDPEYNAFCKDRPILASYGRYWEEK